MHAVSQYAIWLRYKLLNAVQCRSIPNATFSDTEICTRHISTYYARQTTPSKMRFRQKYLGFSGGAMVALGLGLLILGKDTAFLNTNTAAPAAGTSFVNGAAGVPMWTGILVIICGMANIAEAFDGKKKKGPTPYELPFSMTVFLVNFLAMAVTGICMGMLSWSIYDVYLQPTLVEDTRQQAVIGLYATIIVACCFIFIFALMALFVDCCINGFIGGFGGPMVLPPPDHAQRESPYDTYNSRPAMLYK